MENIEYLKIGLKIKEIMEMIQYNVITQEQGIYKLKNYGIRNNRSNNNTSNSTMHMASNKDQT